MSVFALHTNARCSFTNQTSPLVLHVTGGGKPKGTSIAACSSGVSYGALRCVYVSVCKNDKGMNAEVLLVTAMTWPCLRRLNRRRVVAISSMYRYRQVRMPCVAVDGRTMCVAIQFGHIRSPSRVAKENIGANRLRISVSFCCRRLKAAGYVCMHKF